MKTRTSIIITLALILLSIAGGMILYDQLPDPMASHWNAHWQVDGYMSRFWGVFFLPLMAAGLFLLFLLIPVIDPRKANIARFRETFNLFVVLLTAFLLYLQVLIVAWNLGYPVDMGRMLLPAMGAFIFYCGILIGKAKPNWFIGIRTPWTLSSDKVWEETHRLGAILFKAAGLLTMLGIFLGSYAWLFILIPLIGSAVFLILYSYLIYQRELKAAGG
jgi:uncharacterized membrane protein